MQWDITAEFVSAIILCIILTYARKGALLPTIKNLAFQYCLQVTFLSVIANIISTIMLEHYQEVPVILNMTFLLIYYLSTPMMGVVYFIYTLANFYDKGNIKKYALIFSLPSTFYILLVLSNPFTHLLFSFDQVNGYTHGPLIMLTYVIFYIYVLFSFTFVIHKRKSLEKNVIYILGVFPFISALMILFQFLYPKYILTGTAATSALLILYLYLQNKQIFTDTLTSLLNRQEFNKMINMEITDKKEFVVFVISLRDFKFINDKFGQDVGDKILLQVCAYLKSLLPKQLLYRYGGDEFAIICRDEQRVREAMQDIHRRMKNPWVVSGMNFMLKYVVGGIGYPMVADSEEEVIKGLEYAVMTAKKKEQEPVCFCTNEMMNYIKRKYQIVEILKECVEKNSFEVYFQPIFDIHTATYRKAEALLRLPDNPLGFVSPEEFIPIAEENGLIAPITYQVLEKTCIFIKELMKETIDFVGVSVNFSVIQFMQENVEQKVLHIIDQYHIPYDLIKIEITESMLATNYDAIMQFMSNMTKHGIQFLLDDFGTGYSNISYVLKVPFHTVKIDKSLVWQAMKDKKAAILVRKMAEAFKEVGLHVLAEGIETQEHIDFMKSCGCDYLQGYYYSRPLPKQKALDMIIHNEVANKIKKLQ